MFMIWAFKMVDVMTAGAGSVCSVGNLNVKASRSDAMFLLH